MGVELVIAEDREDAANRTAGILAAAAARGGHIALSGGSTPRRAYELAAELQPDWGAVDAWLGDERCVPSDDDRANVRLVRESLTAHVLTPPTLHPVDTTLSPGARPRRTTQTSTGSCSTSRCRGSGRTGTRRSLYPDEPSLDETTARAIAAPAGSSPGSTA